MPKTIEHPTRLKQGLSDSASLHERAGEQVVVDGGSTRSAGVHDREDAEQLAETWASHHITVQSLTQILAIAGEAFDDRDKGIRWLQEPNIQTGNKPPISLIGTKDGFKVVETVLRQIQYGVIG